ncbi:hypothetical protein BH24ACI2_BH24ACI2_15990 [soil metagenome]
MMRKVIYNKAKAIMQNNKNLFAITFLMIAGLAFAACYPNPSGNSSTGGDGTVDPNETAATVNGKAIKLEEVERALKQQAAGQEAALSPMELAAARLEVLQTLIQQEVLFQKAEAEQTVPSEEEVTTALNKLKTDSGKSAEAFQQEMQKAGVTDESLRESIKKQLAIDKLIEKITSKIEPLTDNEIQSFYNSNPEAFKNKRGAQLATIVIDPTDSGNDDKTKNEIEVQQRLKEISERLNRTDFATLAREYSEDPQTRYAGGDWRYFTEDEMKQAFGQGFADYVMNKMQNGDIVPQPIPFEGKILIVKLQEKKEKDEEQTLETPGVREKITKFLIDARKQLLSQSYAAVAMNEAKIENFLAQKVVNNPNELSGARPANVKTPETNTNANANIDVNATNTNTANANSKTENANAQPENKASANVKK